MTVSDAVAARVRQVRKRRDWSPADLAARCAAIGAGHLTENAIENIESGRRVDGRRRRTVTVDELLALAAALNVGPVHLLVPTDDSDAPYPVTAAVTEESRFAVRGWIRGIGPLLDDDDPREFYTEVPPGEFYYPGDMDAGGYGAGPVQQGPPRRPKEGS